MNVVCICLEDEGGDELFDLSHDPEERYKPQRLRDSAIGVIAFA